MIFIISRI